jgi:uncharacterized protein
MTVLQVDHPAAAVGLPSARIFGSAGLGAVGAYLPDGRLHLQHGPIDLICAAWGPGRDAGYRRAALRFTSVLNELVVELPMLRSEKGTVYGNIAQRMAAAVAPFRPAFITPMAAVAGAVAEEALAALAGPGVTRAYVNNGGDVALHLLPGESLSCAIGGTSGQVRIRARDPVRGIATSGWRGRSWSLGIADAVTVLARNAAMADAAATMIANAVDLPGHCAILRRPANDMQADSDLGTRRVTVGVGDLTADEVCEALDRGERVALAFLARGLIDAAALFLQAETRLVGSMAIEAVTA